MIAEYEGDECTVDNLPGICKRLEHCGSVRKELARGKLPGSTCGYDKFHPIICCPTISENATNVSAHLLKLPVGARGRAKCQEYSKYVPNVTVAGWEDETEIVPICKSVTRSLVIGGVRVIPKEYPYMAAVGYGNLENGTIQWQCGGSLISERFVITAAHCTFNLNWGIATWVRLGVLELENKNASVKYEPQDIRIIELIIHPKYKRPSEYHDIAILRLEKQATFNDWVRPTCLPYSPPPTSGPSPTAMGWGQIEWGGDRSNYLLKVTISITEHDKCNATFTGGIKDDRLERGIVDNWQICAGSFGKDTCQGDSGGPLIFSNPDYDCMDTLIGVTSLGKFCGGNTPGIYTRVYNYVSWIEDVVWPDL